MPVGYVDFNKVDLNQLISTARSNFADLGRVVLVESCTQIWNSVPTGSTAWRPRCSLFFSSSRLWLLWSTKLLQIGPRGRLFRSPLSLLTPPVLRMCSLLHLLPRQPIPLHCPRRCLTTSRLFWAQDLLDKLTTRGVTSLSRAASCYVVYHTNLGCLPCSPVELDHQVRSTTKVVAKFNSQLGLPLHTGAA